MAVHSSRTVTRTWYEVVLPNPCLRGDLLKAMVEAEQRFQMYTGRDADNWDDSYEIVGADDELIMRFEVKQQVVERSDSFTEGYLERAADLLAKLTTACAVGSDGGCFQHDKTRQNGTVCPHAEARALLEEMRHIEIERN